MGDIWDALRELESDLGTIGHLTWWYDWGVFVALIVVVGALIWIFYQARNRNQPLGVPQIVALAALVLLLPSLLVRLSPITLLRMLGYDQDPEDLARRLIEFLSGEWDPLEDLRRVKDTLLAIAAVGWIGTVGAVGAVGLFLSAGKRSAPTGQGIRCQHCGRELDITWEYCPYCTPPRDAGVQPSLQFAGTATEPPPVLPTVRESAPTPLSGQPAPVGGTVRMGQPAPTVAWLVIRNGPHAGKQFPLRTHDSVTIGRDPAQVQFCLNDQMASGQHARVRPEEGRFYLHDLASTNGTFVNDRKVQRHLLIDGDRIRVGATEMVFREVRG